VRASDPTSVGPQALTAVPAAARRRYDGTAIGFLLTTHFGGYVPVRRRRGSTARGAAA
jgi:hypothetical protein